MPLAFPEPRANMLAFPEQTCQPAHSLGHMLERSLGHMPARSLSPFFAMHSYYIGPQTFHLFEVEKDVESSTFSLTWHVPVGVIPVGVIPVATGCLIEQDATIYSARGAIPVDR